MQTKEKLAVIETQAHEKNSLLNELRIARNQSRQPIEPKDGPVALRTISHKANLLAQGDSWFDYPGHDLIDYMQFRHGYAVENIGVAGSTLNDIVYGSVPENWFGIPQSESVSRMAELIDLMEKFQPDAVLLSGGGNDIAGDQFFSFVNNAKSGLSNPNVEVTKGVMKHTFKKAYIDLIEMILTKAQLMNKQVPIFVHGYDYPWPDGRGVTFFNIVGPWFHEAFNQKNLPYRNQEELLVRHRIVKILIDELNEMLKDLSVQYSGKVFFIDLRGTLPVPSDWANELHPTADGFKRLSDKVEHALSAVLVQAAAALVN
mgnify:CR=1 FL=1